ncbi:MAG TPA: FtsX-like permease family protein [Solirubrobacter sp.]|nr:FtsX-like permease family protein [Solirubrobacter sp.]
MWRLVSSQLRHRRGRAAALAAGIFLATTSFSVLTATSASQRLEVRGEVGRSFRTAYDLLVRPRGARTGLERERALVRPGAVAAGGGISVAQWRTVLRTPGVAVAAPIAIVGATLPDAIAHVDVTAETAGSPALVRLRVERVSDRGLTRRQDAPAYVWVTDRSLAPPRDAGRVDDPTNYAPRLDGVRPVCASDYQEWAPSGPFDTGPGGGWRTGPFRGNLQCWSRATGLEGEGAQGFPPGRVGALLPTPRPYVLAAIDPEQEAKLSGLSAAVVSGRYLREGDRPTSGFLPEVPVLAATRAYADEATVVTIERLPDAAARRLERTRLTGDALRAWLNRLPGRRLGVGRVVSGSVDDSVVTNFWSLAPPTLDVAPDGTLRPRPVRNDPEETWRTASGSGYALVPLSADDRQFRRVTAHVGAGAAQIGQVFAGLNVVGRFDAARLPGFDDPRRAPLDVYRTPALPGADAASRRALGGRPLLPSGNLAGYLGSPPLLLTNLRSLGRFRAPHYDPPLAAAPIGAIRVRVAGVRGADDVSRERVRRAAEAITRRTGLDVDVTLGSSPAPQRVFLAAGTHGRPALRLSENWLKKGVGVAILTAIDRKSVILFALILVVCALFVGNAASAAVRTRRAELGVLSAVGWTAGPLFGGVLLELAVVGVAAGVAGAVVALGLGAVLDVSVGVGRAAVAVPAAVLLAVLAGIGPAAVAARARPIDALRPPVQAGAHRVRVRGVTSLAVANALRLPGRSALGALSVAIGVAALTLLLAATIAFRGVLVGSLLGSAVSVRVRGTDVAAVVAIVALASAAVADVLFLNVRERAAELAVLRASGWDERALGRVIVLEGCAVGVVGAVAGGAAGLLGSALFAGALPVALVAVAGAAVVAGAALAGVASLVPARALARRGLSAALADE